MEEIENSKGVILSPGDWVVDHMDNERMRKISYFMEEGGAWAAYMEDGGVMGANEIGFDDVYLAGEIPGYN